MIKQAAQMIKGTIGYTIDGIPVIFSGSINYSVTRGWELGIRYAGEEDDEEEWLTIATFKNVTHLEKLLDS